MNDRNSLKEVIKNINTGTAWPAMQLVKANPETAALISKFIKPREQGVFDINKPTSYHNINQSQIQAVSDRVKENIKDNENITQLFPDIELAIQILVSSILSPKDMVKTELIYKTTETIIPPELSMKLNEAIETHMDSHYKIKEDLPKILRETLFDSGSYVKAVLPESIVDEIINNNVSLSTENLSELFTKDNKEVNLGILGGPGSKDQTRTSTALERFRTGGKVNAFTTKICMEDAVGVKPIEELETLMDVTDNYKFLKLPKVVESQNKSRLKGILRSNSRFATESKKISSADLSGKLYKDSPGGSETFLVVPSPTNAKRKSIGRPLVLKLPSESVIPIYIPGDETKHIGYFVLTDVDGNPVTVNSSYENADGLSSIMSAQGQNQTLATMLINKAKRNLINNEDVPTIDQITKVYSSIVEKDLMDRLRNGIYGSNVSISNNEEIYRIMLSRALASKYTRLVYIPGELVTYFAFKYHSNGVGKSYLDDLKVLTSLRAILLFSKVMAMTKNSISLTHVNMTLDPNDPDPAKTVEIAAHEITKMRQQYFPLGINSPTDLVEWIQRAGLEFSFEGHPGLPQTKFDFETKNLQHVVPESDLDELLRKQTYMAFGLTPEVVDNGYNSEFATTVVANNILLSKRVFQTQDVFTVDLSDYCRKVVMNDSIIIDDLLAIMKDNKGLVEKTLTADEKAAMTEDENSFLLDLLERYMDIIKLELPKPDITSIETQSAAFDQYVESLDKTLDAWLSTEVVTSDIAGDINSNIDSIKTVIRAYFIRKWQTDNGYMPELNDIVTSDEDDKPTMDIYEINKNHMEGLVRSCVKFIEATRAIKNASDTDLANMGVEPGISDTTDSDAGLDDFGGTDDDFGLGLDTDTADDANASDANPEEPDSTTDEQ